ncbi:hypothetical protein [Corynebacterium sphenisci]|uniref:hypothetical protein n=1 Tax=Corynebacterium sphenisci TaxID=191493 RepID=UPI0026DF6386|nr:hypothetical protein [Corynebacterium sphenisci]MDO5730483.1 hypothetical protein [Corynebacterium sphenisci]
MIQDVQRASLPQSMPRLGDGGEGVVYALDAAHRYEGRPCAYKEYKPQATIHEAHLRAMVAFLGKLNDRQRDWLLQRTAWPTRIVVDGGRVTGIIMPLIPEAFFGDFSVGQNVRRSQKEVQLLLNDPAFIAKRGIALDEGAKYAFLADFADTLRVLHGAGIVIGDLSARNILFNIGGTPASFLIDCDSMHMPTGDNPALVQTPGWEAPQAEAKATIATDLYKFGLLATRMLLGEQSTRDATRLTNAVPIQIRSLARRALNPQPGARPTAAEWRQGLRAIPRMGNAAGTAPHGRTARPAPAPSPAPGYGAQPTVNQRPVEQAIPVEQAPAAAPAMKVQQRAVPAEVPQNPVVPAQAPEPTEPYRTVQAKPQYSTGVKLVGFLIYAFIWIAAFGAVTLCAWLFGTVGGIAAGIIAGGIISVIFDRMAKIQIPDVGTQQ